MTATTIRYTAPDGTTYGEPIQDHEGRWLTDVTYPDGDRFVTYGISDDVFLFFGLDER